MDITISINDDKINEIIKDNINGISKDEIAKALLEGIKQYIASDKGAKIVEEVMFSDSYYSRSLSIQGKEIIAKTLSGSNMEELEGIANDLIKNNMKEIFIEAVMKILLENLNNKIDFSYGLSMCQEEIRRMIKDEMIKGVNNGY